MFQTFDSTANPAQGPARLADLRQVLVAEGLAGFIIPRADVHQGCLLYTSDAADE